MHQGPPRLLAVASQQVDLELFCQEGSASEYCGPGAALRNLHSGAALRNLHSPFSSQQDWEKGMLLFTTENQPSRVYPVLSFAK